jgi:uncharacterized protein (TIGR03000 family)
MERALRGAIMITQLLYKAGAIGIALGLLIGSDGTGFAKAPGGGHGGGGHGSAGHSSGGGHASHAPVAHSSHTVVGHPASAAVVRSSPAVAGHPASAAVVHSGRVGGIQAGHAAVVNNGVQRGAVVAHSSNNVVHNQNAWNHHNGNWDHDFRFRVGRGLWYLGWGGYPFWWGWGNGWLGGTYPYYDNSDYSYPYYGSDYATYTPPLDSRGYVADAPSNSAQITVVLPDPNAAIWFQGQPVQGTGTVRVLNSPQLNPGSTYAYDVRAAWNVNGQAVSQDRRVNFQAGAAVTVDFTQSQLPAPLLTQ